MKQEGNVNEKYFNPNQEGEVIDRVNAPLVRKHADGPERIDKEMECQEQAYGNQASQGMEL